jgi:hypothetical protein
VVSSEIVPSHLVPFLSSKGHEVFTAIGFQRVSKFQEKSEHRNTVNVFVAVIRIVEYSTDIVISVNIPMAFHPQSSSSKFGSSEMTGCSGSGSGNGELGISKLGLDIFQRILSSFKICNNQLFG